jgi:hypothetical protein
MQVDPLPMNPAATKYVHIPVDVFVPNFVSEGLGTQRYGASTEY